MLKYNILVKVTGSIAAYKSAYLVSKLVQNGFEVKVVLSESAEKFVGVSTFEALSGNKVYTDMFAPSEALTHINLDKWADLIIVVPATANTINKLASGDGSSLITALFLAHDFAKPYLVAPAMNTKMYLHPATQESLQKLKEWGVTILTPDKGYLACGDEGIGKLIEPDIIFKEIIKTLTRKENTKSILITSGGTKEEIDGVRFISNMSTGRTGARIADKFISLGYDVTLLSSENSFTPELYCTTKNFTSFDDLNQKLKELLSEKKYDAVIHLAAVSDYSLEKIIVGNDEVKLPLSKKMDSTFEEINLVLKQNFKIINKIKSYSINKAIKLIGFKLVKEGNDSENKLAVQKLFENSDADFVVLNDFKNRANSVQSDFRVFNQESELIKCNTVDNLAENLIELIND